MATHEQLPSTSSRSPLDPTMPAPEKSAKELAPQSALNLASENEKASSASVVNIGTRRSALAVIQANIVQAALQAAYPSREFKIHAMATMGDKNQVTPLHDFGAKALWTHELEAGLMEGSLDLIVHCLKDMPTQLPDGCIVGCIMDRADPRDVLVMKPSLPYKSIAELPAGSVVGTSSVRRSAQIKRRYPHLKFKDIRGNVGTRLAKLDDEQGEYSCTILAAAGLHRMDLQGRITQYLDSKTEGGGILYAVGQGALCIEIREGDKSTLDLLDKLKDTPTALACLSERSLMRTLEGGCSVPIGVETEWVEKGKLLMKAIVVSLDGTESVETQRLEEILTEKDADAFGRAVAADLVEKGAAKILEAINLNRNVIAEGGGA
jgi:hydroxymethylbilane synthase